MKQEENEISITTGVIPSLIMLMILIVLILLGIYLAKSIMG